MKKKNIYVSLAVCFALAALILLHFETSSKLLTNKVSISIETQKKEYVLGDVIDLVFLINNGTSQPLFVNKSGVADGSLKLYISQDGESYRQYVGPNWGIVEKIGAAKTKIDAGNSLEIETSVLFNHHIPTEHLSELYARKYRKDRVDSQFAMVNAGRFWLKAVFRDSIIFLESEPLAIDISEPDGLDAFVWEKIKTDGAFAYFLQIGSIKYHPDSIEAQRFVESLQQISIKFPNSRYTEKLNEKLIKYNERMENLRRLKQ